MWQWSPEGVLAGIGVALVLAVLVMAWWSPGSPSNAWDGPGEPFDVEPDDEPAGEPWRADLSDVDVNVEFVGIIARSYGGVR